MAPLQQLLLISRWMRSRSEYCTRGAGKGGEEQPLLEGAAGIEAPAHVGKHEAKAVGRPHQNPGHPSPEDLARHLKLSGARIW